MLCCLGDLVDDIVVHLSSEVAIASDTDVTIRRRRGGSAANVAVSAAASGVPVRFIGRVGSDLSGDLLTAELESEGVDARVQVEGRTGSIIVLVDRAGERSMLRDRGAAGELGPVESSWLDTVSWLHVPAYSLVEGRTAASALEVIAAIHSMGVPVSIDASSTAVIHELGVESFRDLVASCAPAVLFCNAEEAHGMFGDAEARLDGVGMVVVKDGPGPATALHSAGQTSVVPAPHLEEAVDTTGAGDAFAAGFIVATMNGSTAEDALASGHQFAERLLQSHR